MTQSRISIIGTGLIGSSIGLALAQRPNRQYEIIGADRDRNAPKVAKKSAGTCQAIRYSTSVRSPASGQTRKSRSGACLAKQRAQAAAKGASDR